ncbi:MULTISPECIES: DUF2007 domain-containing protein [unclassified Halanaerobium]|uniref:putative signal transducing protein n=1 Tax=unclassified Halanaerobium TaxID=2641197 RepID=UPI000DF46D01|nr:MULTISPECIES: DUF2007 domain-containing protein [unclassified Halanaerobium]RCW40547.1 putative signal transducing protein [Halanaerobium sp. MA284_MarDTE_T2]RCW78890.1 putative signal transducing protein [Halanaerobium sp. DL-01]
MSDFKLQHLITTGVREAEMIEALLNDSNIEVIVRHDEFGGYSVIYMGYSAYNVELYVAEDDYKEARELLNGLNLETDYGNEELKTEKQKTNSSDQGKSMSFYLAQIAKIIIIIYLLLNLIALIF